MSVLTIPYPDSLPDATRQSRHDFEQDLKMALASKLFELGRITSGQAAALAGVPRYCFLRALSRYHVNAIGWDPDEIAAEIRNA